MKVVHVELNEPYQGKKDYYFGSLAAIFDTLPKDVVGCGLKWLWQTFQGKDEYKTRKATIRRAEMERKQQKRKL